MKSLARQWLLWALTRGAGAIPGGVPALTYHSIDELHTPISFPAASCRAQLSWLAARGYRAITAREAAAALAGGPLAERAIAITFDDGFLSVRQTAFDLLAEFGFVGTVFCASGYLGGRCGWERAATIPELPMMSWDDARFLLDHGWEIGGHTVSHARLPGLPEARMGEEIAADRRILEERLGCQVVSFAYPYGAFDAECVAAVMAAGYRAAWTMQPVISQPGCDRYRLGRFNCDRVRSHSPHTAALAAQVCLGGRYGAYALLTARHWRMRRGRRRGA